MKQASESTDFDLKLGTKNVAEDDLSEEDDQWALVLMRVYRTKTFVKKSKQSVSHQSIRSENNP